MNELIDVSHYNGTINWQAAAGTVAGAYVKITEGSGYVDAPWVTNHDGARAAGIPTGAYHFADLGNPQIEANHFADVYLQRTWQLAPVLDIETAGATSAWIVAFRSQFRARVGNVRFRVYTSEGFLTGALNPSGWIDSTTTIWAARYNSTLGWTHPALVLWQNSSTANIPGILGNVDIDQFMNGWTPASDQGVTVTEPWSPADENAIVGRVDAILRNAPAVDYVDAPVGVKGEVNGLAAALHYLDTRLQTIIDSVGATDADVKAGSVAATNSFAALSTAVAAVNPAGPTDAQMAALQSALVAALPSYTVSITKAGA